MKTLVIPVLNSDKTHTLIFSQLLERKDLIWKVLRALEHSIKTPQGRAPRAGFRHVVNPQAKRSGKARQPKTRQGVSLERPNTRGGRRAHRPRVEKNIRIKLNKKEAFLGKQACITAFFEQKKIIPIEPTFFNIENKYSLVRAIKNEPVLFHIVKNPKKDFELDLKMVFASNILFFFFLNKGIFLIEEDLVPQLLHYYRLC
jgi:ribosomal protein L4